MVLVEKVLGNAGDPEWALRLSEGSVEPLSLDHWEAQKNRFRKKTASGREVAVSLDRGAFLRDGDVLLWDAATGTAVVARISLRDVMIIHLDQLAAQQDPEYAMRTCIELGSRARQPALAGAGQGRARVRAPDRRPQGHGVGDEDASIRGHPLRIRRRAAKSCPTSLRTNRAGSLAGRKARCIPTHMIASSRWIPKQGTCTGVLRSACTAIRIPTPSNERPR